MKEYRLNAESKISHGTQLFVGFVVVVRLKRIPKVALKTCCSFISENLSNTCFFSGFSLVHRSMSNTIGLWVLINSW